MNRLIAVLLCLLFCVPVPASGEKPGRAGRESRTIIEEAVTFRGRYGSEADEQVRMLLQELETAKEKICELQAENADLLKGGKLFLDFLQVLKKYMFIADGSTGKRYIEMKYVFEEYEEKDFEKIEAMLLALEEDNNE